MASFDLLASGDYPGLIDTSPRAQFWRPTPFLGVPNCHQALASHFWEVSMDLGSYESMFYLYAQRMLASHQSGLPPASSNTASGPSGSSHTGRPSRTSARSKQRADHS